MIYVSSGLVESGLSFSMTARAALKSIFNVYVHKGTNWINRSAQTARHEAGQRREQEQVCFTNMFSRYGLIVLNVRTVILFSALKQREEYQVEFFFNKRLRACQSS